MKISWITVQLQRLKELRAAQEELELDFESTNERDDTFQKLTKKLVRWNKDQLAKIRMGYRQALYFLHWRMALAQCCESMVLFKWLLR